MWVFLLRGVMSLYVSLDDVPKDLCNIALAIGNFDGVHLAHQAIIHTVCEKKEPGLRGALTFSPHPLALLAPEKEHFFLTTDSQKARLLLAHGLDFLIIHPLTQAFLNLSHEAFIEEILINKLHVSDVVIGEDFRFGAKALGNVANLREQEAKRAFKVHVIKNVMKNSERVSSSAIRSYLRAGDVYKASLMLGRPYALFGRVSKGQGLGAPLGFATANLMPQPGFGLARGIYATLTRAYFSDGVKDFVSATSVGTRPTVTDSRELVVETHCLDQNINLLGLDIEVFFITRLRDEIKFGSVSDLKKQVDDDLAQVSSLARLNPSYFQASISPFCGSSSS